MKNEIEYSDFSKLDIRVATIVIIEEIEGADRLWKLTLDVGDLEQGGLGQRVVVAGIKEWYSLNDLRGKQVIYLANLAPRKIRGILSQGMIVAANDQGAVLLHPDRLVSNGVTLS